MKDNIKKAIKEYQCSGCINGYDPVESDCFKPCDTGCGCGAHRAGTFMLAVGKLFLGMPKDLIVLEKIMICIHIFSMTLKINMGKDMINLMFLFGNI